MVRVAHSLHFTSIFWAYCLHSFLIQSFVFFSASTFTSTSGICQRLLNSNATSYLIKSSSSAQTCTNKVGNESHTSPVGKQTSFYGIVQICKQTAMVIREQVNCSSSSDDALRSLNKVNCIWDNVRPAWRIGSWLCSDELLYASKHNQFSSPVYNGVEHCFFRWTASACDCIIRW